MRIRQRVIWQRDTSGDRTAVERIEACVVAVDGARVRVTVAGAGGATARFWVPRTALRAEAGWRIAWRGVTRRAWYAAPRPAA